MRIGRLFWAFTVLSLPFLLIRCGDERRDPTGTLRGAASLLSRYDLTTFTVDLNDNLDVLDGNDRVEVALFTGATQSGKYVVAGRGRATALSADLDFSLARFGLNDALDTTFNTTGKVFTNFSTVSGVNSDDVLRSAFPTSEFDAGTCTTTELVTAAGHTRIGGLGSTDDYRMALARYTETGAMDTAFGTDGKVELDFGTGDDEIASVVNLPDGRFVAAGRTGGVQSHTPLNIAGFNWALAVFNKDGTLDTSFDTDGKLAFDFWGQEDGVTAVALQQASDTTPVTFKILVAGFATKNISGSLRRFPALARFNMDGTIDTTFGFQDATLQNPAGTVVEDIISVGSGSACTVTNGSCHRWNGMAVFGDNIYLVGTARYAPEQVPPDTRDNVIVQAYTKDGQRQTQFGVSDGRWHWDGLIGQTQGSAIKVQADGKILFTGFTTNGTSTGIGGVNLQNFLVGRLNVTTCTVPGDCLDVTFDDNPELDPVPDGVLNYGVLAESDQAMTLALQSGRVLAAGASDKVPGTSLDYDMSVGISTHLTGRCLGGGRCINTAGADEGSGPEEPQGLNRNLEGVTEVACRVVGGRRVLGRSGCRELDESERTTVRYMGGDYLSDNRLALAGRRNASAPYDFTVATWDPKDTRTLNYTLDLGGSDIAHAVGYKAGTNRTLVAVGESSGSMAIAQFSTSGALDTTFDGDGKKTISVGANGAALALVQASKKYTLVGRGTGVSNQDFVLARVDQSGSLDSGFGSGGIVKTDFGSGAVDEARAAIMVGDKTLVAGFSQNTSGVHSGAVARYNANGTLDTTFSGDGLQTVSDCSGGSGTGVKFNAIALSKGSKIVLAGECIESATESFMYVVRLTSTGSLDTSFGNGGKVKLNLHKTNGSVINRAYGVDVRPNEKVLVVGATGEASAGACSQRLLHAAAVLTSGGKLSRKFRNAGYWVRAEGDDSDELFALRPIGEAWIVVGGYTRKNGTDLPFQRSVFHLHGVHD